MGIIHNDMNGLSVCHLFKPSRNTFHVFHSLFQNLQGKAHPESRCHCRQDIIEIESPDQLRMKREFSLRSPDPTGNAFEGEGHLCCGEVGGTPQTITEDGKIDSSYNLLSSGIVRVGHGKPPCLPALHQRFEEELPLAFEISFQGLMVV